MNEYDVLQRLKDELVSLTDKLDRLNKALEGGIDEAAKKYGGVQASLMIVQSVFMDSYQSVLAKRIEDLKMRHIGDNGYKGKEVGDV